MRKIIFSMFFVTIFISGFCVTVNDFFSDSLNGNADYELVLLSKEKYLMDYDKAMIEATTEEDELNAENSYYSSMNSEKSDMISLYQSFLSDLFNLYTEGINLKTNEMNLADASETYQNNIYLNEKKIVSDSDLRESKLSLEEEQINYNTSLRNYNDYLEEFSKLTSISFDEIVLNVFKPENFFVSDEEYLNNDYSLKSSELTLEISEYVFENMSSLSSEYDLKDQEIQVKENKLNYENALESSQEANEDYIIDLNDKYNTIYINDGNLELSKYEFDDISVRYEKGSISDMDYRSSYVNMLNSQNSYYSSLLDYYNTVIEYIISVGGDVSDINF
jgi:hypothetical protein